MSDRDQAARGEFTAGAALFNLSPKGLLECAADWLASAKIPGAQSKGFDPQAPGFAAAAGALAQHPLIFVGAHGPEWKTADWRDSPRSLFWKMAFESSARGAPLLDFEAFVKSIDKEHLARGAKDLLILAARARDASSFETLLAAGAARRSKLVMFSAYQNGGRLVAERVKQPTQNEALDLLTMGSSMSRGSHPRMVRHDWEGFDWLMAKCASRGAPLDALMVARIGANSPDPELLEKAVAQRADGISTKETTTYANGQILMVSAKDNALSAAVAFAAAGSPQAAKVWAERLGPGAWGQLCRSGRKGSGSIPCASWHSHPGAHELKFSVPDKLAQGITIQMTACMSGRAEAAAWARRAYADEKAQWLSAQALAKGLSSLSDGHAKSGELGAAIAAAVALSESTDLRLGIDAPKPAPTPRAAGEASARAPRKGGL